MKVGLQRFVCFSGSSQFLSADSKQETTSQSEFSHEARSKLLDTCHTLALSGMAMGSCVELNHLLGLMLCVRWRTILTPRARMEGSTTLLPFVLEDPSCTVCAVSGLERCEFDSEAPKAFPGGEHPSNRANGVSGDLSPTKPRMSGCYDSKVRRQDSER
eukprot:1709599-Amphidinium_carterae.1